MIEFGLGRVFDVGIEYSYVPTEFGLDRGFYVTTKYFLVATEFGAKAKKVYFAEKFLMSRQSCLSLCRNRVNPPSR